MQMKSSLCLSLSLPCRCLDARKALLPGNHIQVCCSLTGILAIPILFRVQTPLKLIAKLMHAYRKCCSYYIYANACDEYAVDALFKKIKS